MLWWLFLSLLAVTLPAVSLTVLFLQTYKTLQSHISLMSCATQRHVCSEAVVSLLHNQAVYQVESTLCRSKKKGLSEVFRFLYVVFAEDG